MTSRRLGAFGEDRAVAWYESHGYRILDRNWRSGRLGELDVVAWRSGVLIIVEVKARTSDRFGLPTEAITTVKQIRLRKLAASYASEHPQVQIKRIRFDVVSLLADELEVLADAF